MTAKIKVFFVTAGLEEALEVVILELALVMKINMMVNQSRDYGIGYDSYSGGSYGIWTLQSATL